MKPAHNYDEQGFFVSLKSDMSGPKDGQERHFYTASAAVDFVASLQAGDRERGVVLLKRAVTDIPAEMALECLAADGWPDAIYSSTAQRLV